MDRIWELIKLVELLEKYGDEVQWIQWVENLSVLDSAKHLVRLYPEKSALEGQADEV